MTIKSALYWSALGICTAISLWFISMPITGYVNPVTKANRYELARKICFHREIYIGVGGGALHVSVQPGEMCAECGAFIKRSFGHRPECSHFPKPDNSPFKGRSITFDLYWFPPSLKQFGYFLFQYGGGFILNFAWWHPAWIFGLFPLTQVPYLWRRFKPKLPGHCLHCSYNLTGNTSGVCPECGSSIPTCIQSAVETAAPDDGTP